MANRWGKSGNSDRFHFLGSKVTADGDYGHKIKRYLLLGRKAITKLDSILKNKQKNRVIILVTKVHIVKDGFSSSHVRMWDLDNEEGWVPKNWCFWTLVLEKTLETARRSNQSILKEIDPEYSLEGLMLKLQYFGSLIWRADLWEKTVMLGKIEGKRRRMWQMTRWLDGWFNGHDLEQTQGDSEGQGSLVCCSSWSLKESDMT